MGGERVQCENCGAVTDRVGAWKCRECDSARAPAPVAPGTGPYHRSTAAPMVVVGPGVVDVFDTANAAELAAQRLNLAWRLGRVIEGSDAINDCMKSAREARSAIADARRGLAAVRWIRASRLWRDYAMVSLGITAAAAFGYCYPSLDWWQIGILSMLACFLCAIRGLALARVASRELSRVNKGKPE